MVKHLKVNTERGLEAENGGLFVSRAEGIHPTRVLNSYELILVRSGCLGIYEENEKFVLREGDFLLLSPRREHGGTRDYEADLSFYWVHFHVLSRETEGKEKRAIKVPKSGHLRDPERLELLFRRFLNDQESGHLPKVEANLLMALMLCEATKTVSKKIEPQSPASFLAEEAMEKILTEFTDPHISTSKLAEEVGCNPDYLGRVFRQMYGISIVEQIKRTRIKEARRLLLRSELYVKEVAEHCGFNNESYFRRIFKSISGVTPREYRRLYLRMHMNTT